LVACGVGVATRTAPPWAARAAKHQEHRGPFIKTSKRVVPHADQRVVNPRSEARAAHQVPGYVARQSVPMWGAPPPIDVQRHAKPRLFSFTRPNHQLGNQRQRVSCHQRQWRTCVAPVWSVALANTSHSPGPGRVTSHAHSCHAYLLLLLLLLNARCKMQMCRC